MSESVVSPHSLDAERSVLGAIVLEPAAYDVAAAIVSPADFFRVGHQRMFTAMGALAARGEAIDFVTLREQLTRAKSLDEAGGPVYLANLTDGVPRASNVAYYARIVRDKAILRGLASLGTALVREACGDSDRSPVEIAAAATDRLRGLASRGQARGWLDVEAMADLLGDFFVADQLARSPLGLPTIQAEIGGGVAAGEVLGLYARPGVGKTIALLQAALACLDQSGRGVLVFSLEMQAALILLRLARMIARADKAAIKDGWTGAVRAEVEEVLRGRFYCTDESGLSVPQMESRIELAMAKELRGCSSLTVIIDHHMLIGGDVKMPQYERSSKQAREIKGMAKATSAAVLIAIQVSREGGGDGSRRLTLEAARDSGAWEEQCDYVLGLRKPERSRSLSEAQRIQYRGAHFVEVLKSRNTEMTYREMGYQLDSTSLILSEDPNLDPPSERDLAAVMAGRR